MAPEQQQPYTPPPAPPRGPLDRDLGTTIAGGSAGLLLLMSVNWQAVPNGELVKVCTALFLVVFGGLIYRKKGGTS